MSEALGVTSSCVFMAQCFQLMLRIFEFGVLLFGCFVYHQHVTNCLKRFARYGHYAGEVEDIGSSYHSQTCSCLLHRCDKN